MEDQLLPPAAGRGPTESMRIEDVDGDDADNGDAFPRGIIDVMPPRMTAGPDITLAGDGSPLAVEHGPPELIESTLRCRESVLLDKESRLSGGRLPLLPLLVTLSSGASFVRFSSDHTTASATDFKISMTEAAYPSLTHSWL